MCHRSGLTRHHRETKNALHIQFRSNKMNYAWLKLGYLQLVCFLFVYIALTLKKVYVAFIKPGYVST